jgi:hypothetical protein
MRPLTMSKSAHRQPRTSERRSPAPSNQDNRGPLMAARSLTDPVQFLDARSVDVRPTLRRTADLRGRIDVDQVFDERPVEERVENRDDVRPRRRACGVVYVIKSGGNRRVLRTRFRMSSLKAGLRCGSKFRRGLRQAPARVPPVGRQGVRTP